MYLQNQHSYGFGFFCLQLRNFITINITVNAIWSLMFFAQLLPWIGYFIIAIQKMIKDLFQFMLVLVVFMVPFWVGFQRLSTQNQDRKSPPEFDKFTNSIYSTFLISLNAVSRIHIHLD